MTAPIIRNLSLMFPSEVLPGLPVVLAYGGGVNSTALLLRWLREGHRLDAVLFANPGEEQPATLAFVKKHAETFVRERGVPFVWLDSGLGRLVDYYTEHAAIPSLMKRDCTAKFKIAPMERWVRANLHPTRKQPCVTLLGIDAGEVQRVRDSGRGYIINCYPLVGWKMDRQACKAEIARAGLPEPVKSGCRMCIYARPGWFMRLAREDPPYFARVEAMEDAAVAKRVRTGKEPLLLTTKPLAEVRAEARSQRLLQPFDDDGAGDCGGFCRT